jgi:hypothetical protein
MISSEKEDNLQLQVHTFLSQHRDAKFSMVEIFDGIKLEGELDGCYDELYNVCDNLIKINRINKTSRNKLIVYQCNNQPSDELLMTRTIELSNAVNKCCNDVQLIRENSVLLHNRLLKQNNDLIFCRFMFGVTNTCWIMFALYRWYY